MKKHFAPYAAWWALLCFLGAAPVHASAPLDPLWSSALAAFERGEASEAARLFASFVDVAEKEGIRSPEAHYNLGLALWATKSPAEAVRHVAEAARLRSGPIATARALGTLEEMERELGVQEPVSESFSFRFYHLLNRDWFVALASLAFWLVAGAGALLWLRGKHRAGSAPGLMVTGAVGCLVVIGLGSANRCSFGRYGVLTGDVGVGLYREANRAEAKKLADLPPGMIVALGGRESNAIELYRPVSGWVSEKSVQEIEPDENTP